MKKWATLLAGSACALSLFSGSAAADDKELVFMNWGPYINSNILEQFTKETGIKRSTRLTSRTKLCTQS